MPKTRGFDKPTILQSIATKKQLGKPLNKQETRVDDTIQNTDCFAEYIGEDRLRFTIMKLPKSLNARDKECPWVKMEDKQTWLGLMRKTLANLRGVNKSWAMPINQKVDIHLTQYRTLRIDPENNASGLKHPLDSLVDLKVIRDDDYEYINEYYPHRPVHVNHKNEQKLVIDFVLTGKPLD